MPRNRDDTTAVRVYTVCDQSKCLIVRNVPALGCGDELFKLFGSYGEVEEFAKGKLDEFSFLGNQLQVSYVPQFESLSDTKEKLEGRIREVFVLLNLQCYSRKYDILNKMIFETLIHSLYISDSAGRSKRPTVLKAAALSNTLSTSE